MSTHTLGDSFLGTGSSDGTSSSTLFGQTMMLVAATGGFFTLGAWLGRDLSPGLGLLFYIVALILLVAMRFTVAASRGGTLTLLFLFGTTMGLATGETVAYYAATSPSTVWQAAGATALFMVAMGVAGFATNEDLSGAARVAYWGLFGLIIFGVVSIFVNIPHGALVYSILGLVIFAVLTMADFQRLRIGGDIDDAPQMAASIFLDALNVFFFFLQIFNRGRND
jgi:modulator of FtsH protease